MERRRTAVNAHLHCSHMYRVLACVALLIGTAMTNGAKHQEIAAASGDGEDRDWTQPLNASNHRPTRRKRDIRTAVTGLEGWAFWPKGGLTVHLDRVRGIGSKARLSHNDGKGRR